MKTFFVFHILNKVTDRHLHGLVLNYSNIQLFSQVLKQRRSGLLFQQFCFLYSFYFIGLYDFIPLLAGM